MHTTSYWKGVHNTFMLLFGIALTMSTYFIWHADMLEVFGSYVEYPQMLEPFRWLLIILFGVSGGMMILLFFKESYDFDFHFHRKSSTVKI